MEERQHLLREIFGWTEKETEWRFCRAQIVRVWTPTFPAANIFCRPPTFQQLPYFCLILWAANMFDGAPTFYVGADIFMNLEYFMSADISWTPIFHGRRHFMGADILWAPTFHGRRHFMDADILWAPTFQGRRHFWCKLIFYVLWAGPNILIYYDFLQSVLKVLFCNKFAWFLLLIFVYISVSIYACCVRQYFWRKCFWNLGLRLMQL